MWPTVLLEVVFSQGSPGARGGESPSPASYFRTQVSATPKLQELYLRITDIRLTKGPTVANLNHDNEATGGKSRYP